MVFGLGEELFVVRGIYTGMRALVKGVAKSAKPIYRLDIVTRKGHLVKDVKLSHKSLARSMVDG